VEIVQVHVEGVVDVVGVWCLAVWRGERWWSDVGAFEAMLRMR
jgi:hypothetical protein